MTALFSLVPWWGRLVAIGLLILACMAFGAAKMHTHDEVSYDALANEYSAFKAGVKAKGDAAQAAADAQRKSDQAKKEKADHENAAAVAALNADIKRLRDQRAGSSFLPAAPAGANRADPACFDRAELDSALRGFDQSLQGIVDQGSATTVDLDTAKRWAQP